MKPKLQNNSQDSENGNLELLQSPIGVHPRSFTEELLKQTEEQRNRLDLASRETVGTNDSPDSQKELKLAELDDCKVEAVKRLSQPEIVGPKEEQPEITVTESESVDSSITAAIGRHLVSLVWLFFLLETSAIYLCFCQDTRAFIVGELYDTEKNYCEKLKSLHEQYFARYVDGEQPVAPASRSIEMASSLMPSVLEVHGKLLEQLRRRIANWSPEQTLIGDLFDVFHGNSSLVEYYLTMVECFSEIKSFLAKQDPKSLPNGQMVKGEPNRAKFTLEQLLIEIIQRFPRYELLIQRLVKHTDREHCDFDSLNQALSK